MGIGWLMCVSWGDEQGYPDIRVEDEFVEVDHYAKDGELGEQSFGGLTAKDVGMAATDAAALGKAARVGGAAISGATVAAAGAYLEIQDGMDPTEEVVTNTAGGHL
ncbi:hypothetical protein LH390_11310 [Corynebacterium uberis]|uniref:hypothetical protein n=1 Tax=Corynebacterium uberis TaxID=2883169 RepID=UPI001D0AED9D|nr:hypothetical protein [Corynebacterium uberis]UDL78001.1 hypothetical protein LH394_11310 [Corynebacterium uberis]UDL84626.1 hypothetical protein LH390_11310 [Corynebacterium uberis]